MLQVDGVGYVVKGFRDAGKGGYENDGARIRLLGPPVVTEYTGQRAEVHEVEVLLVVAPAASDRNAKMQVARDRLDAAVDLIEARSNATLGGAVNNSRVTARDGGIGEYALDNKGEWVVSKLTVETHRLEAYRA